MREGGGLRVGIDVGGTNTDAVIIDAQDRLLAKVKHPTTPDVTTGILTALQFVLEQQDGAAAKVSHVMLGTTHATNAILERRNLNRVAAIRLGGPATHSIPPLSNWPVDLKAAISCGGTIVDGGVEMTGEPIVPLDEDAVRRFLDSVSEQAEAVAISGVFSPVLSDQEYRVEELVREVLGDVPVSLSHEIGSLGLLERENACVLNAALVAVAGRVTAGLNNAMTANGVTAEAYIAQNDGTLMSLDYVRRYPILTIGSGPTNSMRGASYLTGATDALVVDVGGTSTDIGILSAGFPRESSTAVEIGGVRTNFRMPDLVSLAIGGGTIVSESDGTVALGPGSVGYRLTTEALVFGGAVPTLTDAIVASGRGSGIGDARRTAGREDLLQRAIAACDVRIEDAVDRVKTSGRELPLIAVGGGSGLIPETLAGVAGVHRPENHDVANAIGAAIASVSGELDRVFAYGKEGRDEAIAEAVRLARDEAIRAGADPAHVEVVEIEEVPLAYLTDPVARVRVKAAGPLKTH
ncbi:hydantoinase/oxoprolinase N-terminal domain-containing protein [Pseudonocardia asaccharolytica]|uniref:Hydantoinase subunit beta n=1 Tax=Pseudonocardia asaccharolytica DSM 44247 = NBRC 16224 TaxID=1123024 RepID=A0A511CVF9_9PSEU|nr:hydantoinase/oxoprolinase family protein [Pseudonocardia asaccharolytica]GEL16566.1 hydantoinase subunit beta [Pseudonocardia asaccharolytica DSM 44247 = NBRC 16224]